MDIEDNLITKALLISDFNIINHPVHIITKDNQTSPSAFIPFCDIGGNLSAMGMKMENFSLPVCNSFVATNFYDQVCYEIDLKMFVDRNNIERVMKQGFNFIMDYNEDKQVAFDKDIIKQAFSHSAYEKRRRSQYDVRIGCVKTRHNSDGHLQNVLKE